LLNAMENKIKGKEQYRRLNQCRWSGPRLLPLTQALLNTLKNIYPNISRDSFFVIISTHKRFNKHRVLVTFN
jgi:hypothetical protein